MREPQACMKPWKGDEDGEGSSSAVVARERVERRGDAERRDCRERVEDVVAMYAAGAPL